MQPGSDPTLLIPEEPAAVSEDAACIYFPERLFRLSDLYNGTASTSPVPIRYTFKAPPAGSFLGDVNSTAIEAKPLSSAKQKIVRDALTGPLGIERMIGGIEFIETPDDPTAFRILEGNLENYFKGRAKHPLGVTIRQEQGVRVNNGEVTVSQLHVFLSQKLPIAETSQIVTHEMGHVLGLQDPADWCLFILKRGQTIMAAESGFYGRSTSTFERLDLEVLRIKYANPLRRQVIFTADQNQICVTENGLRQCLERGEAYPKWSGVLSTLTDNNGVVVGNNGFDKPVKVDLTDAALLDVVNEFRLERNSDTGVSTAGSFDPNPKSVASFRGRQAGNSFLFAHNGNNTFICEGGNNVLVTGRGRNVIQIDPRSNATVQVIGRGSNEVVLKGPGTLIKLQGSATRISRTTSRLTLKGFERDVIRMLEVILEQVPRMSLPSQLLDGIADGLKNDITHEISGLPFADFDLHICFNSPAANQTHRARIILVGQNGTAFGIDLDLNIPDVKPHKNPAGHRNPTKNYSLEIFLILAAAIVVVPVALRLTKIIYDRCHSPSLGLRPPIIQNNMALAATTAVLVSAQPASAASTIFEKLKLVGKTTNFAMSHLSQNLIEGIRETAAIANLDHFADNVAAITGLSRKKLFYSCFLPWSLIQNIEDPDPEFLQGMLCFVLQRELLEKALQLVGNYLHRKPHEMAVRFGLTAYAYDCTKAVVASSSRLEAVTNVASITVRRGGNVLGCLVPKIPSAVRYISSLVVSSNRWCFWKSKLPQLPFFGKVSNSGVQNNSVRLSLPPTQSPQ